MEWHRTDVVQFKELKQKDEKDAKVNTFDVAHFADFIQVDEYISRFELSKDPIALAIARTESRRSRRGAN